MTYKVEHRQVPSPRPGHGPFEVRVLSYGGSGRAVLVESMTAIESPEECDRAAIELANAYGGAEIISQMLTDEVGLPFMEERFPRSAVQQVLDRHGETSAPGSMGYYRTLDALAEKVRSSRNWSLGEVFVWAPRPPKVYLILKQVAPGSCEMLVVTPSGTKDVLTAYRFDQEELVTKLLCYVETMEEAAAESGA